MKKGNQKSVLDYISYILVVYLVIQNYRLQTQLADAKVKEKRATTYTEQDE